MQRRKSIKAGFVIVVLLIVILPYSLFLGIQSSKKDNQKVETINMQNGDYKPIVVEVLTPAIEVNDLQEYSNNPSIPILMYHNTQDFANYNPKNAKDTAWHKMTIPLEILDKQLESIKKAGYTTIKVEDMIKFKEKKAKLPKKSIILTFDDSWQNNYQAYKLLKSKQMVGSFAVISNKIKNNPTDRLSWNQIREMLRDGMEILDHTSNHLSLDTYNQETFRKEMKVSKELLEKQLGVVINTIVYPAGSYNQDTIKIAQEYGYKAGITTKSYTGNQNLTKLFELTRYRNECLLGKRASELRIEECGTFFRKNLVNN